MTAVITLTVNVSVNNMEAKFKVTWDYNKPISVHISQGDWLVTLTTQINQLSAQIFQVSGRGGANRISLNKKLFGLFENHKYLKIVDDCKVTLAGRYEIFFDNSLPVDKVYVSKTNFPMNKIDVFDSYDNKRFVKVHQDSPQYPIYKKMADEDENLKLVTITPDMLVGEITIKNYPVFLPSKNVDDETLPYNFGTDVENLKWFFGKFIETVENKKPNIDLASQLKMVIDNVVINSAMEESKLLVTDRNSQFRQKFTIPVGQMDEKEAKTFLDKVKKALNIN